MRMALKPPTMWYEAPGTTWSARDEISGYKLNHHHVTLRRSRVHREALRRLRTQIPPRLAQLKQIHLFPGKVMMLNVPCERKGQFLNQKMSYLKFKVKSTSVRETEEAAANKKATIAPYYSVSSLIARLEIYHGSNLLE